MSDHKTDIKSTVNSLVKIAELMVDNVEGQETQKLSPEEALQAIEEIISQLEQVAEGIPAESVSQEQPPVEAPTQEPTAPVAGPPEEEEKKPDPRVAQLEKTVAALTAQIEQKDRVLIAEKIANFYDNPSEKFAELSKSTEPLAVLQAKLDTITELSVGKSGSYKTAKIDNGFASMVKTAKQLNSNERRHTI